MRTSKEVLECLFLVASLFACVAPSFAQEPSPGKVSEKVITQADPDQSYAAFLPANYDPQRQWPTVFCLDPRARGASAIARFVPAAQKYGFVVICSNNSRNGLDGPTITKIFTTFWEDAHRRLNIDQKRTYIAGFSGGARLAAAFAARCHGCLAGVIATGAGFPPEPQPDQNIAFAYFATAGVDDFNAAELWDLEKKFRSLNAPFHFESFAGGHEWAPEATIERALLWLNLQAMKSGSLATDDKFVELQLASRTVGVDQLLAQRNFSEAQKELQSIIRDFKGLKDVSATQAKSDQLAKSNELKKDERLQEAAFKQQLNEAGEIYSLWMKAPNPDEVRSPRYDASTRIADFRRRGEEAADSQERRLARRVLSQLQIRSIESAQAAFRNNKAEVAVINLQLAKEIDPKNPNLVFELARAFALKRDKGSTLDSLEEAVSLGFKDSARLRSEEAFSFISTDPRFRKLSQQLAP
jgi:dienelactone hydrolase